jgi:hypothetical protein
MAQYAGNTRNESTTNQSQKADGFINFSLVDKDGNTFHFKTGIALFQSRELDSALMEDFEAFTEAMKEGRVTAKLWTPPTTETTKRIKLR